MDAPTSAGKLQQSLPTPNLERYFWLPASTGPDVSDEEWQSEMDRMFAASLLTRDFVSGSISPDDFADGLASVGHNPNELFEMWEEGGTLGY